jgi:hypothetical protein
MLGPIGRAMELQTGKPERVFQDVTDAVWEVVQDQYVVKFCIGRTNGIEKRRSLHGADEIIPVYKTKSADCAASLESDLLDVFHSHFKFANESKRGGGGVSPGDMQYVYIAVWLAD